MLASCQRLQGADDDRPRGEVLHDDHSGPRRDGVIAVGRVGVERLAAAANGDHHLPDPARRDLPGHPPYPSDHLLVGQPRPRFAGRSRCASPVSWTIGRLTREPKTGPPPDLSAAGPPGGRLPDGFAWWPDAWSGASRLAPPPRGRLHGRHARPLEPRPLRPLRA